MRAVGVACLLALSGAGLMLPTAVLETRGARTGAVRRNAIIYFHDGEKVTIEVPKYGTFPAQVRWVAGKEAGAIFLEPILLP